MSDPKRPVPGDFVIAGNGPYRARGFVLAVAEDGGEFYVLLRLRWQRGGRVEVCGGEWDPSTHGSSKQFAKEFPPGAIYTGNGWCWLEAEAPRWLLVNVEPRTNADGPSTEKR